MSIEKYISEEKIKQRVEELGKQISEDYKDTEELIIITVLNGAFIFAADLVRNIDVPLQVEFISASSYGDSTTSSGNVKIDLDLKRDIVGKDVLLVEDIVDTGLTLNKVLQYIKEKEPKSLKLASMLFKPARLKHPVDIHYLGMEIEDKFVVGLGLDYAGRYRELPYIGIYNGD